MKTKYITHIISSDYKMLCLEEETIIGHLSSENRLLIGTFKEHSVHGLKL